MPPSIDPQLLRDLEAARASDETPAWVRVLLGMLATLVHSMQQQMTSLTEQLAKLTEQLQDQQAQNAILRKQVFGRRSERTPRDKKPPAEPKPPKNKAARTPRTGASALDTAQLPEQTIDHTVPDEDRCCPQCGGKDFVELAPEVSREFELELSRLIRRFHRRQKLACRCGGYIVTAPPPDRVTERGLFGATLHADTVVRRCMDAIPLNRMADMYQRAGIPIGVSTLNDLFHATATKLERVYGAMKGALLQAAVIHADETPHRVLAPGKCDQAYLWSFSSDTIVYFVHAGDRSGLTPKELLENTRGILVADGYSGYNVIEGPESRIRAGCMAHMRRKFVEATATDPERAGAVVSIVACLYLVESAAKGTSPHDRAHRKDLRDSTSRELMEYLRATLDEIKPQVRPKSPIGRAVSYAIKQWPRLCVFLEDPDVPIDNNEAERQLRRPVLGRKTSLFVGNHDCGQRYAINYSLVLTCRKVGINPTEYLDWLLKVIDDYSSQRIHELLPHNYLATRARLEAAVA